MPDPLSRLPDEFTAGDTVEWTASFSDFPSTDWNLAYTFAPADGTAGPAISIDDDGGTITAEADGGFTIKIDPTTSATFADETVYSFVAYVTDGTDRYTVDSGRVTARRNLAAVDTDVDTRSVVKKTLDQIRARISDRSLIDQDGMSVSSGGGSRSVNRMNLRELLHWEAVYARKYEDELRRERIRRGLPTSRAVKVRFVG